MILDLLYTIIFISIGISTIKYRRILHSWTGNFYWAEKYIGRGGTYFVIMLLGMLMIFLGVLQPFGGLDLLTPQLGNGVLGSES